MAASVLDPSARALSLVAERWWPRRLVFQHLPEGNEQQTDARGFPVTIYTDIDPEHPIPCRVLLRNGNKLIIAGQEKVVTFYELTIPKLRNNGSGWIATGFNSKLRVRLLASDTAPEVLLQIVGGGASDIPGLTFEAAKLEDLT